MQTPAQSRQHDADDNEPLPPRGPAVETLTDAIEQLTNHDVPGTLGVSAIETIEDAAGFPFSVGRRTVREARITKGDPRHGAKRSDDHVSRYKVVLPIKELDFEAFDTAAIDTDVATGVPEPCCDECGNREALYRYQANGFAHVSWAVGCPQCETIFDSID